jgi:3D (Asp-Asp-Asp) domain-containing protein
MDVIGYNETVQALLSRLGVPTSGDFVVSVDLNTAATEGMQIRVDHILQNTEVIEEEIPFETVYCYDSDLAWGEQTLVREGVAGQRQLIANVDYCNGEETNRTVMMETMLCQPVDAVVVVCTGKKATGNGKAPAIGDGVIVTDDGQILTYSSSDQFKATAYTHTDEGCDMTTATGTTVRVGTVAVDPKLIPYGTRMFIVTNDGAYIYGVGTAEDCGGAIKGNRLDLYFPTDPECWAFGVRMATVYFLD